MNNHTPGTWRNNGGRIETELMCINGLRAWFTITKVHLDEFSCIEMSDGAYNSGEDANLIAAAPEMYEACKTMIAWFDSERTGPDYGTLTRDTHPDGEKIWRLWWDNQLDLCKRAETLSRAALTKVEGL